MPPGNEAVVTARLPVVVMLKALVCVLVAASVTFTVKLLVAAAVGVPAIAPVPAVNVRPAGNVPAVMDHVYGVVPPLAPSIWLYGLLIMPSGIGEAVVMVRAPAPPVTVMLSGDEA